MSWWRIWWYWIVIVILVILVVWCWTSEPEPDVAHLILEHRDAADWIDFANAIRPSTADVKCEEDLSFRPGLLFQVGHRNYETRNPYEEIRIHMTDETGAADTVVYDDTTWVWLNIVSESTSIDPPLATTDAFGLYPNGSTVLGESECKETIAANMAGGCNRNRCISGNMEQVRALITYFQGANGWKVSAVQTEGACTGNSFRFSFLDSFRVEVYEPEDPLNGTDMGTPKIFAEVDSIVVATTSTPPELGDMQPPPWVFP